MAAAIIVSGVLMVVMADTVSNFLKRNRMYEVLGLFVLLIALNACLVGVLSVVLVRAAAVDPGDLFPIGADPSDPNAR